jgi:hypothetical protein
VELVGHSTSVRIITVLNTAKFASTRRFGELDGAAGVLPLKKNEVSDLSLAGNCSLLANIAQRGILVTSRSYVDT